VSSEGFFGKPLSAVNLGLKSFHESLRAQGAASIHVEWKPPAASADLIAKLERPEVEAANAEALKRLCDANPVLAGVERAGDVVPGLVGKLLLHAGPPIGWERMCGPVRGAVLGAVLLEGWAQTLEDAESMLAAGEVMLEPCHHHGAVGPMAGVLSPSMWVWVVHNDVHGNDAYCSLNEGLGKVLRFGANSPDVLARLAWMRDELGPALKKAVAARPHISVRALTAQALLMGDECHNRNVAATTLLLKELLPGLLRARIGKGVVRKAAEFISSNPHFYLNLSMAACKCAADTILGLANSTVLSAMARNGTEIGIRVAGLGDRWFTAPAGMPKGLYFAGFSASDSNPDLGDSTISEVAGVGAFAMASAPAIVQFIGGAPSDAIAHTRRMYEICLGRHPHFKIPVLDFAGTPVAVDVRRVVETGVTPIINTGIAHRLPGVGQIGAGILDAPSEMFHQALAAMAG